MSTKHTKAYEFLDSHKLAVLSTLYEKDQPWGTAIYYVVDKDLNFYFITHKSSQKYQNIKHDSDAAITVADDQTQTTVQAYGKISEVPLGEENDMAFRKIAGVHPPGQYQWTPPVSKDRHEDTALLKLTPSMMQFSNFKPETPPEDGVYTDQII